MRTDVLARIVLVALLLLGGPGEAASAERSRVVIGLASSSISYLPLYLAAEPGVADGITVELVTFQGGAPAVTALAGGSVDIALASLDTLIGAVNAGQPVRAFYAGFNHAELEWFAQPTIRTWNDMRGRAVGVSATGSLSDFLTRHVLKRHGLEPGRDVTIVSRGGPGTRWQALRAGRVDATVLPAPARFWAEAEGFTRLAVQARDVTREWPTNVMFTRMELLESAPQTMRAWLRTYVRALRLARADRNRAVEALVRHLKLERRDAERTYDEGIGGFDERGALPAEAMPIFWEVAVAAGEIGAAWPEARFLDRRFLDTFGEWAPPR